MMRVGFRDFITSICHSCFEEYVDEETGLCPACDADHADHPDLDTAG